MAFEFLDDILDVAGDLAGVGKAVVGIADLFGGQDDPRSLGAAESVAGQAASFAQLLDPSSPGFQSRAAEEEATLTAGFAEGLKDLIVADARQRARGMPRGILNPERRDEAIAQAVAQQRANVKQQARQNVHNYLTNAAAASRGAANAYTPLVQTQGALDSLNRSNTASGWDALFTGLQTLSGNPDDVNISVSPWVNPDTYGGPIYSDYGAGYSRPVRVAGI